jgi:hypothetical protein
MGGDARIKDTDLGKDGLDGYKDAAGWKSDDNWG